MATFEGIDRRKLDSWNWGMAEHGAVYNGFIYGGFPSENGAVVYELCSKCHDIGELDYALEWMHGVSYAATNWHTHIID